ncbi:MAG: hypothetical protein WA705_28150 [Candidatus Ozemobacteraceae bacterium]
MRDRSHRWSWILGLVMLCAVTLLPWVAYAYYGYVQVPFKILDENGAPMSGAVVTLWEAGTGAVSSTTSALGEVDILKRLDYPLSDNDNPRDNLSYRVTASGYFQVDKSMLAWFPLTSDINPGIASQQIVKLAKIPVYRGFVKLPVKVVDMDGQVVSGAQVSSREYRNDGSWREPLVFTTDVNGEVAVMQGLTDAKPVPEDRKNIGMWVRPGVEDQVHRNCSSKNYSYQYWIDGNTESTPLVATETIVLKLMPIWGEVRVPMKILDDNQQPVATAEVWLGHRKVDPHGYPYWYRGVTNGSGTVQFTRRFEYDTSRIFDEKLNEAIASYDSELAVFVRPLENTDHATYGFQTAAWTAPKPYSADPVDVATWVVNVAPGVETRFRILDGRTGEPVTGAANQSSRNVTIKEDPNGILTFSCYYGQIVAHFWQPSFVATATFYFPSDMKGIVYASGDGLSSSYTAPIYYEGSDTSFIANVPQQTVDVRLVRHEKGELRGLVTGDSLPATFTLKIGGDPLSVGYYYNDQYYSWDIKNLPVGFNSIYVNPGTYTLRYEVAGKAVHYQTRVVIATEGHILDLGNIPVFRGQVIQSRILTSPENEIPNAGSVGEHQLYRELPSGQWIPERNLRWDSSAFSYASGTGLLSIPGTYEPGSYCVLLGYYYWSKENEYIDCFIDYAQNPPRSYFRPYFTPFIVENGTDPDLTYYLRRAGGVHGFAKDKDGNGLPKVYMDQYLPVTFSTLATEPYTSPRWLSVATYTPSTGEFFVPYLHTAEQVVARLDLEASVGSYSFPGVAFQAPVNLRYTILGSVTIVLDKAPIDLVTTTTVRVTTGLYSVEIPFTRSEELSLASGVPVLVCKPEGAQLTGQDFTYLSFTTELPVGTEVNVYQHSWEWNSGLATYVYTPTLRGKGIVGGQICQKYLMPDQLAMIASAPPGTATGPDTIDLAASATTIDSRNFILMHGTVYVGSISETLRAREGRVYFGRKVYYRGKELELQNGLTNYSAYGFVGQEQGLRGELDGYQYTFPVEKGGDYFLRAVEKPGADDHWRLNFGYFETVATFTVPATNTPDPWINHMVVNPGAQIHGRLLMNGQPSAVGPLRFYARNYWGFYADDQYGWSNERRAILATPTVYDYHVTGLNAPGTWTLILDNNPYENNPVLASDPVQTQPRVVRHVYFKYATQSLPLDIDLGGANIGFIAGRVMDEVGNPVPGAYVRVYTGSTPNQGGLVFSFKTDTGSGNVGDAGKFKLPAGSSNPFYIPLEEGNYWMDVASFGQELPYHFERPIATFTVLAKKIMPVNYVLDRIHTASGTVTIDGETPPSGSPFRICNSGGETSWYSGVYDGKANFGSVKPGTYTAILQIYNSQTSQYEYYSKPFLMAPDRDITFNFEFSRAVQPTLNVRMIDHKNNGFLGGCFYVYLLHGKDDWGPNTQVGWFNATSTTDTITLRLPAGRLRIEPYNNGNGRTEEYYNSDFRVPEPIFVDLPENGAKNVTLQYLPPVTFRVDVAGVPNLSSMYAYMIDENQFGSTEAHDPTLGSVRSLNKARSYYVNERNTGTASGTAFFFTHVNVATGARKILFIHDYYSNLRYVSDWFLVDENNPRKLVELPKLATLTIQLRDAVDENLPVSGYVSLRFTGDPQRTGGLPSERVFQTYVSYYGTPTSGKVTFMVPPRSYRVCFNEDSEQSWKNGQEAYPSMSNDDVVVPVEGKVWTMRLERWKSVKLQPNTASGTNYLQWTFFAGNRAREWMGWNRGLNRTSYSPLSEFFCSMGEYFGFVGPNNRYLSTTEIEDPRSIPAMSFNRFTIGLATQTIVTANLKPSVPVVGQLVVRQKQTVQSDDPNATEPVEIWQDRPLGSRYFRVFRKFAARSSLDPVDGELIPYPAFKLEKYSETNQYMWNQTDWIYTDGNGSFTLLVEPNVDYYFTPQDYYGYYASSALKLSVNEAPIQDFKIRLESELGEVTGQIASGEGGVAIRATVLARHPVPGQTYPTINTSCDSEGKFRLVGMIPNLPYQLVFRPNRLEKAIKSIAPVYAGRGTIEVTMESGFEVRGRMVDQAQEAFRVASVPVRLDLGFTGIREVLTTETDRDGGFVFRQVIGGIDHRLAIVPDRLIEGCWYAAAEQSFQVTASGTSVPLLLSIEPAGAVRFRLVDENGFTIRNGDVSMEINGRRFVGWMDQSGWFRVERLPGTPNGTLSVDNIPGRGLYRRPNVQILSGRVTDLGMISLGKIVQVTGRLKGFGSVIGAAMPSGLATESALSIQVFDHDMVMREREYLTEGFARGQTGVTSLQWDSATPPADLGFTTDVTLGRNGLILAITRFYATMGKSMTIAGFVPEIGSQVPDISIPASWGSVIGSAVCEIGSQTYLLDGQEAVIMLFATPTSQLGFWPTAMAWPAKGSWQVERLPVGTYRVAMVCRDFSTLTMNSVVIPELVAGSDPVRIDLKQTSEPARLIGQVVRLGTGTVAVADAKVTLNRDLITTTNASGVYEFFVPQTEHLFIATVQVSKPGFVGQKIRKEFEGGLVGSGPFDLGVASISAEVAKALRGTVSDTTGSPLSNAKVRLGFRQPLPATGVATGSTGADRAPLVVFGETSTDVTGRFVFNEVPASRSLVLNVALQDYKTFVASAIGPLAIGQELDYPVQMSAISLASMTGLFLETDLASDGKIIAMFKFNRRVASDGVLVAVQQASSTLPTTFRATDESDGLSTTYSINAQGSASVPAIIVVKYRGAEIGRWEIAKSGLGTVETEVNPLAEDGFDCRIKDNEGERLVGINVPAGELPPDVDSFSLTQEVATQTPVISDGLSNSLGAFDGPVFNFEFGVPLGDAQTRDHLFEITLKYNSTDTASLEPRWFNDSTKTWSKAGVIDPRWDSPKVGYVTFKVTHLTKFALVSAAVGAGLRCDIDGNGKINLTDAVFMLGWINSGRTSDKKVIKDEALLLYPVTTEVLIVPTTLEDLDGNGKVNLTDVVFLLGWINSGRSSIFKAIEDEAKLLYPVTTSIKNLPGEAVTR